MRKTTNYGLALYDKEDKMSITAEENSLNANMKIIDSKLKEIENSSGGGNGSGLTTEQINALDGMFKVCAFIKEDVSTEYNAFITAFTTGGGGETPDTEKTLVSISAIYTGGNVKVGTSVNDLTGITVIATYTDGSTATITDYTLIGTIGEGNNIITVSYGGKTTTFTVTGVAESGGEETNDTTAKIAEYGYSLLASNSSQKNEDMCYTELYDISDIFDGVTANYAYIKGLFKYSDIEISQTTNTVHLYVDTEYRDYKNSSKMFKSDGTEGQMSFKTADYSGEALHIKVTLQTAHIDDSYLYIAGNGRVLFAGKNTPYYNMANIDGTPFTSNI